jgi:hypothetical protein
MDETSKVRALKQAYLRENILEAGYSGEDFLSYLSKEKSGGRPDLERRRRNRSLDIE